MQPQLFQIFLKKKIIHQPPLNISHHLLVPLAHQTDTAQSMSKTSCFIGTLTPGQNPEIKCDSRLLPWGFRNSERASRDPPCSHQQAILVHQDELIFTCSHTQCSTRRSIQAGLTLGQGLLPRAAWNSRLKPGQEQNFQGKACGFHRSHSRRERPPAWKLSPLPAEDQSTAKLSFSPQHLSPTERKTNSAEMRGSKRLEDAWRNRLIAVPFPFLASFCTQTLRKSALLD